MPAKPFEFEGVRLAIIGRRPRHAPYLRVSEIPWTRPGACPAGYLGALDGAALTSFAKSLASALGYTMTKRKAVKRGK